MKKDPDIKQMLLFKEGNTNAFRVLFTKYKKPMINFCYKFCGDKQMAEELSQEVFIRVYKAAPSYKPDAKFSTWIYRIATNLCLNELRRKKHSYETESIDQGVPSDTGYIEREFEDTTTTDPNEHLEERERDTIIRESIRKLPKKQRAAILLRVSKGFSYQEIGKHLNSSESGVKSLIHRGRQNLKDALTSYFRGD